MSFSGLLVYLKHEIIHNSIANLANVFLSLSLSLSLSLPLPLPLPRSIYIYDQQISTHTLYPIPHTTNLDLIQPDAIKSVFLYDCSVKKSWFMYNIVYSIVYIVYL